MNSRCSGLMLNATLSEWGFNKRWARGLEHRQIAQITILAEKAGKTHFLIQLALYFHA